MLRRQRYKTKPKSLGGALLSSTPVARVADASQLFEDRLSAVQLPLRHASHQRDQLTLELGQVKDLQDKRQQEGVVVATAAKQHVSGCATNIFPAATVSLADLPL